MEEKIAVFTVFTFLLFAVSTARIALDPAYYVSKSLTESAPVADSNIALSNDKPKSEFDETAGNDRLPEPEKTQTFDVSTQRPNFARGLPINRHFFDRTSRIPLRFVRRHPCRKFGKAFMIPQTKLSYGNDQILSGQTYTFDPKAFGDRFQTKWLEFKHDYGHRHQHKHHHGKEDEFVSRYTFDREKLNSLSRHHKEKKREHEGGFMKGIRKFLKRTFD